VNLDVELVTSNDRLLELFPTWMRAPKISIDTETTGLDIIRDLVAGLSISSDGKKGYYVPFWHTTGPQCSYEVVRFVMEGILRNPELIKIFHNAKYDMHLFLNTFGIRTVSPYEDTMVEGFLIDNTIEKGLKPWSKRLFDDTLSSLEDELALHIKRNKLPSYAHISPEFIQRYGAADAIYTFKLHEVFQQELQKNNQVALYHTELELIDVVLRMERWGIQIDPEILRREGDQLKARLPQMEQELNELVGRPLNPRSPKQVASYLFGDLGLPILLRTAAGNPSSSEEVLLNLPSHPSIPMILALRTGSKVISTYVDGILEKLDAQNRLHCRFNQLGAGTGRFSSSKPNLQNIPREGSVPISIRSAFVPSLGYSWFLIDYKQAEMYLFAHYANDPQMIEAVSSGFDFHRSTGALIFNKPLDEVTKVERKFAKKINFGYIYGIGPRKLARELQITERAARGFLRRYNERFPGIPDFVKRCKADYQSKGYVESLFGRRRFIPYDKAYRSVNTLVQGTVADLIKQAMVNLKPILSSVPIRLIIQVHDELIFEIPDEFVGVVPEIERVMQDFKFRVPVRTDVEHTTTTWANKKPWRKGD